MNELKSFDSEKDRCHQIVKKTAIHHKIWHTNFDNLELRFGKCETENELVVIHNLSHFMTSNVIISCIFSLTLSVFTGTFYEISLFFVSGFIVIFISSANKNNIKSVNNSSYKIYTIYLFEYLAILWIKYG